MLVLDILKKYPKKSAQKIADAAQGIITKRNQVLDILTKGLSVEEIQVFLNKYKLEIFTIIDIFPIKTPEAIANIFSRDIYRANK